MADTSDKRAIYYIPDNYISETKLHIGQMSVRGRYLLDSVILSLLLGVIAVAVILLIMPHASLSSKFTVLVIICGPGFIFGQIGFNGDPVSTTFLHFLNWRKVREIRLYNTQPRLLGTDPVRVRQEDTKGRDSLVDAFNAMRESYHKKVEAGEMVEGETFEFRYDPGIDDYLDDAGDYPDASASDDGGFDIEISSDTDLDQIRYVFSSDGYNDPDEEDEINLSDFETN